MGERLLAGAAREIQKLAIRPRRQSGIGDPIAGNNSATDTDTLTPQANLAITKNDGATTAVPGKQVTYTILASNPDGPSDAPDSEVHDAFSVVLGNCSWTCNANGGGSCTPSGTGAIADVVDLPVGSTATYTATCNIDSGAIGVVSNSAIIATATGITELDSSDNSSTDTDTLAPEADLWITKSDGAAEALPGDALNYTIVAGNNGPSDALVSSVEDHLPADLTGCSWTCSPDPGALCTSGPISGDLVDSVHLPAGLQATFTVDCTVDPTAFFASLSNTATITAATGVTEIADPYNNLATDTDVGPVIFADGFESGDISNWLRAQTP